MSELTFKVYNVQEKGFEASTSLPVNRENSSIRFLISAPTTDKLRVVFPVWMSEEKSENKKLKEELCLFSEENWNAKKLNISSQAPVAFEIKEEARFIGILELSNIPPGNDFEFEISGFTSIGKTGTATCTLLVPVESRRGGRPATDWIEKNTISIAKVEEEADPVIIKFRAQQDVFGVNQQVQLKWAAENVTGFKLGDKENFPSELSYHAAGRKTLKLTAINKTKLTEKELEIDILDESKLRPLGNVFEDEYDENGSPMHNKIVTGVYPYGEKIYAIVLNKEQDKAYLFSSDNGLFSSWEQIFRSSNDPVVIPTDLANSPGLVYEDKLWLFGGSAFHPDKRGNDYGRYNFKTKLWEKKACILTQNGWEYDPESKKGYKKVDNETTKKSEKKYCSEFTPRMGHSCLVVNGKLWLLGGYNGAGTMKDVWTSDDGMEWTVQKRITLPTKRCMMGATVHKGNIWIYGGYQEEPGGREAFADLYELKDSSFKEVKVETTKGSTFRAFALAATKSGLFLFSTMVKDGSAKDYIHKLEEDGNKNIKDDIMEGKIFGMSDFEYHLQLTAFKEGVFLRTLQLASNKKGGVKGATPLHFFYFKKS